MPRRRYLPQANDEVQFELFGLTLDKRDESKDAVPVVWNARLGCLVVAPERKDVEQDGLGLFRNGDLCVFRGARLSSDGVSRVLQRPAAFTVAAIAESAAGKPA